MLAFTPLRTIKKPKWWQPWTGLTTNRRILRSTAVIAVLTLIVRAVGLGREVTIAAYFGTNDQVDAYLTAFLLPNFVVNVLAGSLNTAFIPIFVTTREQRGAAAANRLFGSVLLCTSLLLLAVTVVLTLLMPMILPALAPAFTPAKLALSVHLFHWLSPVIALQGLITIWSAVLNAGEEFALPAILPAVATLVALGFLVAGFNTFGIYSLAIGYVLGFGLQAVALGWLVARRNFALWPRWDGWTPELRRVLEQYLPMIAGALLLSGTNLVEQFMAASLPAGSVASLGYAARLTGVANGICAMALGTAVLPHFSAMVARANWVAVRHTLRTYRWLIFLAGGMAAVGLFAASGPIVWALFRRGQFTAEDARLVASLQRCYALQLPFYAGGIFLVRLISSLHANKYLMWGSLISLLLNIALNALLISHLGLVGVALTNSLMYVLSFAYLSIVVWRLLDQRLQLRVQI